MVYRGYQIFKSRFLISRDSPLQRWEEWEYKAEPMISNTEEGNLNKEVTQIHHNLFGLAKELATFEGKEYTELASGYKTPNISSKQGTLVQQAVVSDDELGKLAILILQYKRKRL